jgi:hypothetical protein
MYEWSCLSSFHLHTLFLYRHFLRFPFVLCILRISYISPSPNSAHFIVAFSSRFVTFYFLIFHLSSRSLPLFSCNAPSLERVRTLLHSRDAVHAVCSYLEHSRASQVRYCSGHMPERVAVQCLSKTPQPPVGSFQEVTGNTLFYFFICLR